MVGILTKGITIIIVGTITTEVMKLEVMLEVITKGADIRLVEPFENDYIICCADICVAGLRGSGLLLSP